MNTEVYCLTQMKSDSNILGLYYDLNVAKKHLSELKRLHPANDYCINTRVLNINELVQSVSIRNLTEENVYQVWRRSSPLDYFWHNVGTFSTKEQAELKANQMKKSFGGEFCIEEISLNRGQ